MEKYQKSTNKVSYNFEIKTCVFIDWKVLDFMYVHRTRRSQDNYQYSAHISYGVCLHGRFTSKLPQKPSIVKQAIDQWLGFICVYWMACARFYHQHNFLMSTLNGRSSAPAGVCTSDRVPRILEILTVINTGRAAGEILACKWTYKEKWEVTRFIKCQNDL